MKAKKTIVEFELTGSQYLQPHVQKMINYILFELSNSHKYLI